MAADNVVLICRWLEEVWNQGRLEVIDELFAPDAVSYGLVGPQVELRGPAAYKKAVIRFREAFSDIQLTLEDYVAGDDKVAIRWTLQMRHTGDLPSVSATGQTLSASGMSLVRIQDGQIVEGWNCWDTSHVLRAIDAPKRVISLLEK